MVMLRLRRGVPYNVGRMARRAPLKVGDIIEIPIDEMHVGYGQIFDISQPGKFYMGVFDATYPHGESPDTREVASNELLFVGETLDALLFHGRWRIIGNASVTAEVPYPWYRVAVGAAGIPHVANYARTIVRPAEAHELALVDHRVTSAPIILENALKARHGIGDWRPEYDQLTIDHARQQAALFAR
jgi:hypothetical protein